MKVKMILDSISPAGRRITTIECTYWRSIHAELMTHRVFSRNAASSRAIPIKRMLEMPMFLPKYIGAEQKGMQSGEELQGYEKQEALASIAYMYDVVHKQCIRLAELGVHKSIINRYLEPWRTITIVITSTDWKNFFALRCHQAAEKHFQELANCIKSTMASSTPVERTLHFPYAEDLIDNQGKPIGNFISLKCVEDAIEYAQKISTARCARLSYLTHDGKRDLNKDLGLYDKLMIAVPKHSSPAEHPCTAMTDPNMRCGNLLGWASHRYDFEDESVKEDYIEPKMTYSTLPESEQL